ncbi:protein phosphatase CheZ [Bradyrhizobium sp. SYSU BS000235]|uniref:protein phosphatase CheZ n=1 Tax=Bradyrhizobium sp. SYSU BS000235 TaxID=3411332 RepID=UPI003C70A585
MAIQRRRFRIEENQSGGMPVFDEVETSVPVAGHDASSSHHREVMSELRAIRAQMATPSRAPQGDASGDDPVSTEQLDDAKKLLDTYRAQIEQCEKLKVELDLIHDAISRTKQEIAVLHGGSFSGDEMAKVTGELGAVVGGTEEATQQILEAAEAIDHAASALTKMTSPDQQAQLSEDIQERVVAIFEACNFQDLTGQRISKVMTTMKFIEHHINVMMDIWGGVDAIKVHAPAIIDTRVGDARLLNGPKGLDDEGHVSQDDIDALFD